MDKITISKTGAVMVGGAAIGWTVGRGAYQGTTDDRLDRWYATRDGADLVDRTGPGYATRREAAEAAAEWQADYNAA